MKNVIVKTQALKKYYKTGNQTVKALDGVDFVQIPVKGGIYSAPTVRSVHF